MSAGPDHLDEVIDRLTTLGLVDSGAPIELAAVTVEHLLSTAAHEGLVCLLGAAVDSGQALLAADDELPARDAWGEVLARAVQLDALLLEVCECLALAGIGTRALKGAAVATLDEVDPAWRSYNDVDVLVPADQLLAAADALATLGLRPATYPVSRRWAGRYAKSLTLVHTSGAQVDLHRLLATGPFGTRLRAACLFESSQPFMVGGATLMALSDVHRFLHACYHAVLGGVRGPRHRRDILLLASKVPPEAAMRQVTDGWSLAVVHAAVTWAGEGGPAVPVAWHAWLVANQPDSADTALLARQAGSFRDSSRSQLRAERGALAKVRYGSALVWPSRANLRDRGRTRRQHLLGLLRARRPGPDANP